MSFFYITDEINSKTKSSERNKLKNFIEKIKSLPSNEIEANLGEVFPLRNIWVKQIGGTWLIITKEKKNDNEVYIFLKAYESYDEKSYDEIRKFIRSIEKKNNIQDYYTDNDRMKINKLLNEGIKPPLDEEMKKWLESPKFDLNVNFYESKGWVNNIKPEFRTLISKYCKLIENIHDKNMDEINIRPLGYNNINLASDTANEIYILYQEFHDFNEKTQKENVSFFLIDNHYEKTPSTDELINEIKNKYPNALKYPPTVQNIISYSRRAYPESILAEAELWGKMELSTTINNGEYFDKANLALSGEELEILKNSKLPLFINGHAGSGKSTMLLYIFASYIAKSLKEGLEKKPVFLTYSKKLLESSKNIVKELLEKNPEFINDKISSVDIEELLDKTMFSLSDFLLYELFKDEDLSKDFDPDKYINYSIFKKSYLKENKSSKPRPYNKQIIYDPTLVWHTIRTLIKSDYKKSERTVEDYLSLERKKRTVEKDVYEKIYKDVYLSWYKKLSEDGYWDDMDLIHKVASLLETKQVNKFPVIICDEAQDFSSAEFKLFFNLHSIFDYEIETKKGLSVPMAFAGDPLQTINPTGFRWEHLKASFYEVAINSSSFANKKDLYQELNKNYRSDKSIVDLANLLLFYRDNFLNNGNLKDFKPQVAWSSEGFLNKIIIEENIIDKKNEFLEYLKSVLIILPVEQGEVEDYVKKDKILKDLDYNIIKDSIFTVADIKGLEFQNVLLYKVTEALEKEDIKKIFELDNETDSSDLKFSYFFNKLYVAITRARESLYIFDTKDAYNNFWKHFTKEAIESLKNSISEKTDFIVNYQGYVKEIDTLDEIKQLVVSEPNIVAQEFEWKGLEQEDSDLLRRAASFYRKANEPEKARSCEAKALEFERRWNEAGFVWKELKKNINALECFWNAANWEEIIKLKVADSKRYKIKIARFMLKQGIDEKEIYELFGNEIYSHIENDNTWKKVINDFWDWTLSLPIDDKRLNLAKALLLYLDTSKPHIIRSKREDYFISLAQAKFKLKKFYEALNLLERINNIENEIYAWSRFFIASSDSEKLDYLRKITYGKEEFGVRVEKEIKKLMKKFIDDPLQNKLTGNYFHKFNQMKDAVYYWDKWPDASNERDYLILKEKFAEPDIEKIRWFLKLLKIMKENEIDNENVKKLIKRIKNINSDESILEQIIKDDTRFLVIDIIDKYRNKMINFDEKENEEKSKTENTKEKEDEKITIDVEELDELKLRLVKQVKEPRDWFELLKIYEKYGSEVHRTILKEMIKSVANIKWDEKFSEEFRSFSSKDRKRLEDFIINEINLQNNSSYINWKYRYNLVVAYGRVVTNINWHEKFSEQAENISNTSRKKLIEFIKEEVELQNNFENTDSEYLFNLANAYDMVASKPDFSKLSIAYEKIVDDKTTPNKIKEKAQHRWIQINKRRIDYHKMRIEKLYKESKKEELEEEKSKLEKTQYFYRKKLSEWQIDEEVTEKLSLEDLLDKIYEVLLNDGSKHSQDLIKIIDELNKKDKDDYIKKLLIKNLRDELSRINLANIRKFVFQLDEIIDSQ